MSPPQGKKVYDLHGVRGVDAVKQKCCANNQRDHLRKNEMGMMPPQVRQIKEYLLENLKDFVDMRGVTRKSEHDREVLFLSRSLAAFSIMHLTGATPEEAGESLIDGRDDNGIDAVFFHQEEKALYLVQSKWKQDGTGSIDVGETLKFLRGVEILLQVEIEKFNKKVKDRSDEISNAIHHARYIYLVLAYTGKDPLSQEVNQCMDEQISNINSCGEIVFPRVLDLRSVHNAISQDSVGAPINIDVLLNQWGQVGEPYQSFYGQVSARDLVDWFEQHKHKLFSSNIRTHLGDTDVNEDIIRTLKESPQKFWYYNNGITALCSSIRKTQRGGSSRESGLFECKDVSIVNGAQTVGSIAKAFILYPSCVEQASVPIRFISLENCEPSFEQEVTRSNNTQNKIDSRDFVALDKEQERIRNELKLDGIYYAYKSGDLIESRESGFDLDEATQARACFHGEVSYVVWAKGKISQLWSDIEKSPYTALFNKGVEGSSLWKLVQIIRLIQAELNSQKQKRDGKKEKDCEKCITHGNLFIAYIVFRKLPKEITKPTSSPVLTNSELSLIQKLTVQELDRVVGSVNTLFPNEYTVANIFKNQGKCRSLVELLMK